MTERINKLLLILGTFYFISNLLFYGSTLMFLYIYSSESESDISTISKSDCIMLMFP